MTSAFIPNLWTFLALTVVIGGVGAFVTGRAMALTWRGAWKAVAYMVPLAGAVRFLHFALFEEATEPLQALVCAFVLALLAIAGFSTARRRQMALQYPWLGEASH